jgi:formylglycine-generating enzyme required for sulfatase activity
VAVGLTAFVMIILTVASIWISAERKKAVREREVADEQRLIADQQRELADAERVKAQTEERRAVQALEDLKKAIAEKERAQKLEEQAKAKAEAAEETATVTRDQLAKSGMLLDNSWWTFGADEASTRQQQAAEKLGMPAMLEIALGGNETLTLAIIPPGEFVMGSSPKEENRTAQETLHRVQLTRAFYLARFELTESQWQAIVGAPPAGVTGRDVDPKLPVSMMSAEKVRMELLAKVQRFAPKGWRFDLPSEAQWEYACRAGTATAFSSGEKEAALARAGWYVANSERKIRPIGGHQPNAFGLYDMHGNVSEICRDDYVTNFYMDSATEDPVAYVDGLKPVLRGGGILNLPEHCRSAYRSYIYRRNQYQFVGVRLALIPADTPVPTSRAAAARTSDVNR